MSLPKSRHAYNDCYEALDHALADEKGVRIAVANYDAALMLRMRLHQARQLHRKDNELAYEEGHAMHGASPYDELVVRIRESKGRTYVQVEKITLDRGAVEALSEVEDDSVPAYESIEALERVVENVKRRV